MLKIDKANKIQGEITVPGDKSISHRAIILSSISKGPSRIEGFLRGEDCLGTIDCFRQLGVDIVDKGSIIYVHGKGLGGLREPGDILDVGNSGTTIRLVSGILAGQNFFTIITGDESIRQRPMDRIAIPLRQMGANIHARGKGNLAPMAIWGGDLKPIDYTLPVPSAQIKSAILLAGLYTKGETSIRGGGKSRDHTERMLGAFGANILFENNLLTLRPSTLYGQEIQIPGDISSAAFFIAGAAVLPGSHLRIKNVGLNPTRTGIIDIIREMGGNIEIDNQWMSGGEEIGDIIVRGGKLRGINIGGNIIPRLIDEIPVIAVIAALAQGKTLITGAEELKVKETNRISAMVEEMNKLGIRVKELADGMEIHGPNKIHGGQVESHGDHRIAMALAIAGLFANSPVKIKNSNCIGISFPGFEESLKKIAK